MALEEAAAWLDGDLVLPIGGKKYRVPEPSVETAMRMQVLLSASRRVSAGGDITDRQQEVLTDQEEVDTYRLYLGPAYDQMVADAVTFPRIKHAAFTALFHFMVSPEVAEAHWNRGVQAGKASSRSPRPATRRTTAAASTTKARASGSGTRSPKSS